MYHYDQLLGIQMINKHPSPWTNTCKQNVKLNVVSKQPADFAYADAVWEQLLLKEPRKVQNAMEFNVRLLERCSVHSPLRCCNVHSDSELQTQFVVLDMKNLSTIRTLADDWGRGIALELLRSADVGRVEYGQGRLRVAIPAGEPWDTWMFIHPGPQCLQAICCSIVIFAGQTSSHLKHLTNLKPKTDAYINMNVGVWRLERSASLAGWLGAGLEPCMRPCTPVLQCRIHNWVCTGTVQVHVIRIAQSLLCSMDIVCCGVASIVVALGTVSANRFMGASYVPVQHCCCLPAANHRAPNHEREWRMRTPTEQQRGKCLGIFICQHLSLEIDVNVVAASTNYILEVMGMRVELPDPHSGNDGKTMKIIHQYCSRSWKREDAIIQNAGY